MSEPLLDLTVAVWRVPTGADTVNVDVGGTDPPAVVLDTAYVYVPAGAGFNGVECDGAPTETLFRPPLVTVAPGEVPGASKVPDGIALSGAPDGNGVFVFELVVAIGNVENWFRSGNPLAQAVTVSAIPVVAASTTRPVRRTRPPRRWRPTVSRSPSKLRHPRTDSG